MKAKIITYITIMHIIIIIFICCTNKSKIDEVLFKQEDVENITSKIEGKFSKMAFESFIERYNSDKISYQSLFFDNRDYNAPDYNDNILFDRKALLDYFDVKRKEYNKLPRIWTEHRFSVYKLIPNKTPSEICNYFKEEIDNFDCYIIDPHNFESIRKIIERNIEDKKRKGDYYIVDFIYEGKFEIEKLYEIYSYIEKFRGFDMPY